MISVIYSAGDLIRRIQARQERDRLVRDMRVAAVAAAATYLQYHLVQNTPVGATAQLRQSTTIDYSFDRTQAFVGPTGGPSTYAVFVEEGTRPHMPPFAPISYWVARKMGAPIGSPENRRITFGVMFAIARRGTKPTHYIRNTWSKHRANAETLMARAARQVLERWHAA